MRKVRGVVCLVGDFLEHAGEGALYTLLALRGAVPREVMAEVERILDVPSCVWAKDK